MDNAIHSQNERSLRKICWLADDGYSGMILSGRAAISKHSFSALLHRWALWPKTSTYISLGWATPARARPLGFHFIPSFPQKM